MGAIQYLVNCGIGDNLTEYYPRLISGHRVLPPERRPDDEFGSAVKTFVGKHETELANLMDSHVYQANPPLRVAQLSVGLAYVTRGWGIQPIAHIDVGSATGIGTLLGKVEVTYSSDNLGNDNYIVKSSDPLIS